MLIFIMLYSCKYAIQIYIYIYIYIYITSPLEKTVDGSYTRLQ